MFPKREFLEVALGTLLAFGGPCRGETPHPIIKIETTLTPSKGFDRHGDPLPSRALTRLGTVRLRHGGWVLAAVFSRDGKTLISFGGDDVIRTWRVRTGKLLRWRRLQGSEGEGYSAAVFSPDGNVLAVGCHSSAKAGDRLVLLCDPTSGKVLNRLVVSGASWYVESLAFSPTGKMVAAGDYCGRIHLWEVVSGKLVRRIQWGKDRVTALAFSLDGTKLVSGNARDGLAQWVVAGGKKTRTLETETPTLDSAPHFQGSIAFSPDGKTLASSNSDPKMVLWNVITGNEIRRLTGHEVHSEHTDNRFHWVIFTPDGKTLITDNDNGWIEIWEVSTGKKLRRFDAHRVKNYYFLGPSLALSPDGKTLASWTWENALRLWDVATGKEISALRESRTSITSLSFSPDGLTLASGSASGSIRLWRPAAAKELRKFTEQKSDVQSVSFTADGKVLAAAAIRDKSRFWEVATGKELPPLRPPKVLLRGSGFASLAFSRSGRLLASGYTYDPCCLWDWTTGKLLRVLPSGSHCCAFSPDDRLLATAGYGQAVSEPLPGGGFVNRFPSQVCLWDVAKGKKRTQFSTRDPVLQLAFSPDGRMLATITHYWVLDLWEIATAGQRRRILKTSAIAFSPVDRVFAQGRGDGTIVLWNTLTAKEILRLGGHQGSVKCLAFSPNGRILASGSTDSTVLLWDVADVDKPLQGRAPALSSLDLTGLWNDLADKDAQKAYRAMAILAESHQAARFLKERLGLRSLQRMDVLIRELDSPKYKVRKQATEELAKLGSLAEPRLRAAMRNEASPEMRMRLERLLHLRQGTALAPFELRLVRVGEILQHFDAAGPP